MGQSLSFMTWLVWSSICLLLDNLIKGLKNLRNNACYVSARNYKCYGLKSTKERLCYLSNSFEDNLVHKKYCILSENIVFVVLYTLFVLFLTKKNFSTLFHFNEYPLLILQNRPAD